MKMYLLLLLITLLLMYVSLTLSKKTFMDKEKTTPFECGFDPYLISRTPFSLRFFKLTIIFLIFDIEIILILPIPLMTNSMNQMFMMSSLMILIVILLGLLYEWSQGCLDWMN